MRMLAAFAALVFLSATAQAQEAEPAREDQPVVAVMFFSSFCAACRVLDPRIEDVEPDFAGRPVEFLRLNQTWSMFNREELDALAEEHGVSRIWEARRGQTGFVALVDPADGDVLDILTVRETRDQITRAIERALQRQGDV